MPSSVVSVKKGAFWGCSSLVEFELPKGVNMLDQGVLANCQSLRSVALHEGVLSIGYGAFYNCSSLQTLTLPSAVVSVGDQALRGCSGLKELRVMCGAAPMCSADIADANVYANALLRVPAGLVGEYGFARIWDRFANVEEIG